MLLVGERIKLVGVFLPEEVSETGVLLPELLIIPGGYFVVRTRCSATVNVDFPVGVDDLNPLLCSGPIGEIGVRFRFSVEDDFLFKGCTGVDAKNR